MKAVAEAAAFWLKNNDTFWREFNIMVVQKVCVYIMPGEKGKLKVTSMNASILGIY